MSSWVRLLDGYAGPPWTVEEFALIASHLGEGPRKRPRYELVESFTRNALGRVMKHEMDRLDGTRWDLDEMGLTVQRSDRRS